MDYDFDKLIDRKNTGSLKWEKAKGMLPMWVADKGLVRELRFLFKHIIAL